MLKFADEISKLCIDKYKSLKKTGKPCDNEWTVLSGIVLQKGTGNLSVVSLATGTKCLGASELLNESYNFGDRLSDSHAEVIAKRALWRYLYHQIDQLLSLHESDIFIMDDERIQFQSNVLFHFYCSQTPCGDCSIIPKINTVNFRENEIPLKIMKVSNDAQSTENRDFMIIKEETLINDIHRTGAKCVDKEKNQDLHLSGVNYHVTGPLRTKPGRGDPTMSMSCSDKLAKWNILGLQGALLSLLIPKLRLESIIIGADCPFALEAMTRGLYERFNIKCTHPKIIQSSVTFMHLKNKVRVNPCPSSIVWCRVPDRGHEVAVQGRKQGASKTKKANYLSITRRAIFETFLKIVDKHPHIQTLPQHPKKVNYYDCKQQSTEYQQLWNHWKATHLQAWPTKPVHLQQFCL